MKFSRTGLFVAIAGALLFWLALQPHVAPAVDWVFNVAIIGYLVVLSVAMVIGRFAGKTVVGQAGAFRELRRWFRG